MNINENIINSEDIDFIRIIWCDNANIIRAKAVHKDSLTDSNYSIGISEAQQGIPSIYDAVVPESGLTPVGEVQLKADLSTFTSIPYSPGQGRVMADMIKNGRSWNYCPRGFLKKMIKQAAENNISVKGAFENEFYLLKRIDEVIIPSDNTPFASTYSMDINNKIIRDIIKALTLQGLQVEQYYPESGPGQQEITIKYTDALNACNNQIVFRETVKAIAYKHDTIASFLPKIFADKPGNGCHLHCSLWNDDKNLLSDSQSEYGISELGRQFIAGIFTHLPALMAITTPIPNSYKRIKPNAWTGAFQCWGIDNREAALRIVTNHNKIIRDFELKTVDASSNPYLAFGAVIAAGLDGIKNEMELPKPIQEDPATITIKNQKKYKINQLPSELETAIIKLQKDKVLLTAMGSELSKAYIEIKKAELRALRNLELEEEIQILLEKY